MANKLLIIMVNSDPQNPTEVGPPLNQATVAAAMEFDVEVVLSGRSSLLAKRGLAEGVPLQDGSGKSVYDVIKAARQAGVRFKVCAPTLEALGDEIIPEIDESVGGAYVISEAMDKDTVTLTY